MPAIDQRLNVQASAIRCARCSVDISVETSAWVACSRCLARHHTSCWRSCARCSADSFLDRPPTTIALQPKPASRIASVVIVLLVLPVFIAGIGHSRIEADRARFEATAAKARASSEYAREAADWHYRAAGLEELRERVSEAEHRGRRRLSAVRLRGSPLETGLGDMASAAWERRGEWSEAYAAGAFEPYIDSVFRPPARWVSVAEAYRRSELARDRGDVGAERAELERVLALERDPANAYHCWASARLEQLGARPR